MSHVLVPHKVPPVLKPSSAIAFVGAQLGGMRDLVGNRNLIWSSLIFVSIKSF